jgi:hypothetical protein
MTSLKRDARGAGSPALTRSRPLDEGDREDRDRQQNGDQRIRITREIQFEHDVFRPFSPLDGPLRPKV